MIALTIKQMVSKGNVAILAQSFDNILQGTCENERISVHNVPYYVFGQAWIDLLCLDVIAKIIDR